MNTTLRVSAEGNMTQRAAGVRQGIPPLPTAPMQSAPTTVKSGPTVTGPTRPAQKKPGPASPAPADDVFEVPAADMDLAQLVELAKKIVERKP
jgi:hypothetical protein